MAYTYKYGDRPLDGLTIQRAVGRGGFGEVYYAVADSGKQLALKYLRDNPEIELRGIGHVLNLKSPYLINIHDVRHGAGGEVFVLMEYVNGPSLRDLMNAEPTGFSLEKAAFFFTGIAKGLAYLHERGIVHRDLKPANIFYDDGYVKIGDYGLSKHISVSRHSGQTASVGTVHYMAPEIGSGSYTKAIDIYALGVILYEMLTGRLPFTGASLAEILMRHLNDRPDVSGIPAPFGPVIAKALSKDPRARYQDANEMLAAVAESHELMAGASRFDASQLTHVARHDPTEDQDRTLTTPPPARPKPPSLDVRDYVPAGAPVPPHLGARWERRVRELSRRLEHKEGQLARRFGGEKPRPLRPLDWANDAGYAGGKVRGSRGAAGPTDGKSRWASLTILVMATLVASLVLAVLSTPREVRAVDYELVNRAALLAMTFLGATLGTLLAYFFAVRRAYLDSPLLNRLAYAGVALIGLLPALSLSSGIRTVEKQRVSAERFLEMQHEQTPGLWRADGLPLNPRAAAARAPTPTPAGAAAGGTRSNRRQVASAAPTQFYWQGDPVRELKLRDGQTVFELTNRVEDTQFTRLLFIPLIVLLLCDFTRRIQAGQRGLVQSGEAFWPAIIGLIAAGILDADNYLFIAAGLCGGISLLTQGAAAAWPIQERRRGETPDCEPAPENLPPPPPPSTTPTPAQATATADGRPREMPDWKQPDAGQVLADTPPRADAPTRRPGPGAIVIDSPPGVLPRLLAGLGWLALLSGFIGALTFPFLQSESGRPLHDWLPSEVADEWLNLQDNDSLRGWPVASVALGGLLLLAGRALARQAVLWRGLAGIAAAVVLTVLIVGPQSDEIQAAFDSLNVTGEARAMRLWKVVWIFAGFAVALRLISLRRSRPKSQF